MINKEAIEGHLTKMSCNKAITVEVLDEADSTNQWLMQRPYDGKETACFTDNQTQGRGRRGREWQSKPGASLCMSYLNRLPMSVSEISGFSLAVAVYCRDSLQQAIEDPIQLKWPNDLLLNGKKVAGILIETQKITDDYVDLVIGIGVNIADVYPEATSLQAGNPVAEIESDIIAAKLSVALHLLFNEYVAVGFKAFKSRWLEHDAWLYEAVQLQMGEKQTLGLHQGVTDNGELILNINGNDQTFAAGEVSVRHASSR